MKLIRIIHRTGQIMEFLTLSEFFRLAGIYVQEYQIRVCYNENRDLIYEGLTRQETQVLEKRRYDITFWILGNEKTDDTSKKSERLFALSRGYFPVDCFPAQRILPKKEREIYLKGVLDAILMRSVFQDSIDELQKLCTIYCENDLLYHGYDMRYYIHSHMDDGFFSAFLQSYQEAEKLSGNQGYIQYFKINCERKVNESCNKLGKMYEFSNRRLIKELCGLADTDKSWHTPYVLAAYIADQEPGLQREVIDLYRTAIDTDNNEDSYLYYRIGKFYEKADKKMAMKYYQRSFSVDPGNYRAAYKVAYLYEFEKMYEDTWRIYNETLDRLLMIAASGTIQPMEIEYILKIYIRLIWLCRVNLKRKHMAGSVADEAADYIENLSKNHFFRDFYIQNAEKKEAAMMARLPIEYIQNEKREMDAILYRYRLNNA